MSSRARFHPTFPAPTITTYMAYPATPSNRICPRTAASSSSIAVCVGQTVWSPCSAYQRARAGSSTRTTTRSIWNRRFAIWAITRFVLSPSVEATNASASSMPAASSASSSSAVPSVKRPPRSSQLSACPRSRSAIASASSSKTETSCPSVSIELAIAEPTRPQPTIKTIMRTSLYSGAREVPVAYASDERGTESGKNALAGVLLTRRRRGQDHPAGRLLDHVAGGVSDEAVTGPTVPAENGTAPDPGGLLRREHDRLDAAPSRLRDDRLAGGPAPDHGGGHLHALVFLADLLGPRKHPLRLLHPLFGDARIDRQRHRDLEDVKRLQHRAVALLGLLRRESSGRPNDVVVQRGAQDGHEDAPVFGLNGLLKGRGRDREPAGERLALPAAIDDVEHDAEGHPDSTDHAGALVQRDHAQPRRDSEQSSDQGRHRDRAPAHRDRERHPERARAAGLPEAQHDHGHVRDPDADHRAESEDAGEEIEIVRNRERERQHRRERDRDIRGSATPMQPANGARDLAVRGQRVGQPGETEHLAVHRDEQHRGSGGADDVAAGVHEPGRVVGGDDAQHRCLQVRAPELGLAPAHRLGHQARRRNSSE